jgi:hypothetical protein
VPSATTPSSTPVPAIVGKWRLDRTCAAIVRALTEAKLPGLIPRVVSELIIGGENGLPAGWDPANPCANAKPPIKHAHTFWPDGRFNSYDEQENTVDNGRWLLVDADTIKIGEPNPGAEFNFAIQGDQLRLAPVIPKECTTPDCLDSLSWQFAVAFPGETWERETSGPHVP